MARVIVHQAAIRRFLFSEAVYGLLADHMDRVLVACQSTAPTGKTGRYKRSFFMERSGFRHPRSTGPAAAMLVGSTDPAAAHIEWGTRNGRAHHTMAAAFWSSARP